jgi:hypothetical protein
VNLLGSIWASSVQLALIPPCRASVPDEFGVNQISPFGATLLPPTGLAHPLADLGPGDACATPIPFITYLLYDPSEILFFSRRPWACGGFHQLS